MSSKQRIWSVIIYMLSAIVDFALQRDISVEHTYTCACTMCACTMCACTMLLSIMLELDHDILYSLVMLKGNQEY